MATIPGNLQDVGSEILKQSSGDGSVFTIKVGGTELKAETSSTKDLKADPTADLLVLGGTGNLKVDATASTSANLVVTGNSGDNEITLGSAPAQVDAGPGNDTIKVGTGAVQIKLDGANQGNDVITGFKKDVDKLVVSDRSGDGAITIDDLKSVQSTDKGLVLTFPDGSAVTLEGVKDFSELSFVISDNSGTPLISKAVGTSKQDVAISTGSKITGTDKNDTIIGNSQDNTIDAGKGNDVFLYNSLKQGHDTLVNLNIGDKLLVTDRNGDGKLDANDLLLSKPGDVNSALSQDANGTTIKFADGTSVTLQGVQVKTLDELHVHIEGEYGVFE